MMYRAAILGTIFIAAWMGFAIPGICPSVDYQGHMQYGNYCGE